VLDITACASYARLGAISIFATSILRSLRSKMADLTPRQARLRLLSRDDVRRRACVSHEKLDGIETREIRLHFCTAVCSVLGDGGMQHATR
jgi:hypothetical protein